MALPSKIKTHNPYPEGFYREGEHSFSGRHFSASWSRGQPDTQSDSVITLVGGPPGAGKTTYVLCHFRPGHLIVDVDAIYQALSGLSAKHKPQVLLPFVLSARDAVLKKLMKSPDIAGAWVITSEANAGIFAQWKQKLAAKSVMIVPTPDECKARIAADADRQHDVAKQCDLVDAWFQSCGAEPGAW